MKVSDIFGMQNYQKKQNNCMITEKLRLFLHHETIPVVFSERPFDYFSVVAKCG